MPPGDQHDRGRPDQIHARQRSGCGGLLAGPHAARRRRVVRFIACRIAILASGRHRQRRSGGDDSGGGHAADRRIHRPARSAAHTRASLLHGVQSEKQRQHPGHSEAAADVEEQPHDSRPAASSRQPLPPPPKTSATRAINMPTTSLKATCRLLGVDKTYYRPTDRGRSHVRRVASKTRQNPGGISETI